MGLYRIHSEPVRRHYFAAACSCSALFQLVVIAILIVSPYLLAYNSEGMWIFERCYRFQPDVRYKHQAYFIAQNGSDFSSMAWSTNANFNKLVQKRLRVPTLRSYEEDTNLDGKKEYLDIELELPLNDYEKIDRMTILLLFDYQLSDLTSLRMESAAYYEFTGSGSGSSLSVDGHLVFHQRDPLEWDGVRDVYNTAVINSSSLNPVDYDLVNVLQNYEDRNETTAYEPRHSIWKGDRGASQPFLFKMRVRYRPQRFCFRPGVLQELKNGWIQYLALLIPMVVLASYVQWFVFNNRVLRAVVKLDPFTDSKRE